MPLSRYEIRSEYSLANPDLYRAAEKDDPEGLLEGVAMAGLVGIIRQLGDLAEFAAEVFHDLHEDVLATAARGHELLVRVRQLEREVPLVENLMFTKTDRGNFMHNPGVEWHVHIHNEQNHFTQGDLPRFIRSAYEDCRSPPRLFGLDRFDVTGAGACLKRFTDPSFFKTEWASSELLKAEKEQRDQRARRLKKKGQRQENGEVREARIASHMKPRAPSEVEDGETSSIPSSSADSSNEQHLLDSLKQENEDMLTASSSLLSGKDGQQSRGIVVEQLMVEELPLEPSSGKGEVLSMETSEDMGPLKACLENGLKEVEVIVDDSSSDTENFMDAVTTMDSEVETDTETKARAEVDFVDCVIIAENEAPEPQPVSESPREAGEEQISVEDYVEHMKVEGASVRGEVYSNEVLMPEVLSRTDQVFLVEDKPAASPEREDLSFVNGHFVTSPAQTTDALTLDSPEDVSLSIVKKDAAAKSAESSTDSASRDFIEVKSSFFLDSSHIVASSENNVVPASNNGSGGCSPVCEQEIFSSSNKSLELGSTEHIDTTSETLEANNTNELHGDEPSALFRQQEESGVSENQNQPLKVLGSASTRKRWQIDGVFDKVILAPDLAIDSSQASESEQSPKKLSLHSSPSSSIQPMRWALGTSKSYHTDDEIDGLQGSLGSLSSSSSTLSSPRPSTLATTLQSLILRDKQTSSSLPLKLADSSSTSPVCSPPKSGITAAVHESVSLAKHFTGSAMSPDADHSAPSSPRSSSSAVQPFFDSLPSLGLNLNTSSPENMAKSLLTQNNGVSNMESFPPPPPLPPLAWRMTRRSHSAVVGSSEPVKPPTETSSQRGVEILTSQLPQAFMPSTSVIAIPPNTGIEHVPDDSRQPLTHETRPLETNALQDNSEETLKELKLAGPNGSCAASVTSKADASQEESVSVLAPSSFERENNAKALPDSSLQDSDSNHTFLTRALSTPARLDETRLVPEAKSAGGNRAWPLASQDFRPNFERNDFSAEATTSSDINRFKRRSKWALTSTTASSDDREVLLQQIRTRSFSLRNFSAEKLAVSRPVTNINVAAILEKANAIRQAFAGSDEDDEDDDKWSDA
ncbi:hypothetical protein GOP47_0010494 [Adiantum capillus-veneris]|uniref:Protein SCAR n=1 Tax=Adiantum capillus-veneris TaxID=13818 RepID=A0A9D4UV03_ADICA|nr:hypothetical protein GOP47_0010494 [Adiantum capillus-veneris]